MQEVFSPECKWRLVEEYGLDSFTEQPDGRLLFSFGFTDRESIISWVLTYGSEVELLEPKEFREDLRILSEELWKKYKES